MLISWWRNRQARKRLAKQAKEVALPVIDEIKEGQKAGIFIPAGIFAKGFDKAVAASGKSSEALAALNWSTMWTGNLVVVTLGNLIGGGIMVGVVYWFVYVRLIVFVMDIFDQVVGLTRLFNCDKA